MPPVRPARASRKPKFTPSPEAVVEAIRARGSDARDLRDAAHEACHAIELGLDRWNRESIHAAMMRLKPADRYSGEVIARAVEGIETKSVEHWAFITCIESVKNGVDLRSVEMVERAILAAMRGAVVRERAAAILTLAASTGGASWKARASRKVSVHSKPASGKALLRRSPIAWARRCHLLAAEAMKDGRLEAAAICLRAADSWLDQEPDPRSIRKRAIQKQMALEVEFDGEVRS